MYISSLSVRGLRDLPVFQASELGRAVSVRGPDPAATALGDALQLVFAALDPAALQRLLATWELLGPDETAEVVGAPFPEQATWSDRLAAAQIVDQDGDRSITVDVGLALDPPLFGELRAQAAKLPRLVTALSQGAALHLKVGALFANSLDAVALSIQSVSVGTERFASAGSERPPWVNQLLTRLAGRFHRHQPTMDTAALALRAATSRAAHGAYTRWQADLQRPDQLGAPARAALGPGDRPALLIAERPASRWGQAATQRAAIAASVHLMGADILWIESADSAITDRVSGENSPLEQVWRVCADGELLPSKADTASPPLGMRRP